MNNMYKILESFDSLQTVTEAPKHVDEELQKIAHSYPREVKLLLATGDFDKDLYSALFDYYNNSGEMPYGIAKARDGDPYEWIFQRFTNDMGTESPLSGVGQDAGLGLNKAMQDVEEEIRTYGGMGGAGSMGGMTESSADFYRKLSDLVEGKKSKPDFLDLDKDGNKKEPMKKAAKEVKEAAADEPAEPDSDAIAKKKAREAARRRREEKAEADLDDLSKDVRTTKTKSSGTKFVAGRAYGGAAQKDEPEDDEDSPKSSTGAAKKRGRPAGSKRAIGAKGPTGKSKLLKKGAIKEGDDEGDDMVKLAKVIASCTTPQQLKVAQKMASNFLAKHASEFGSIGDAFNAKNFHKEVDRATAVKRDLKAKAQSLRGEEPVAEKAPPGAKAERMVKGIKKSLSKDGHLSDKDKAIAYATTWKAHKQGKVEEGYNVVKSVKSLAKELESEWGPMKNWGEEELEYIGSEAQIGTNDVAEILGLSTRVKPAKSWDIDADGNKYDLEERSTGDYSAKKARAGKDIGKPGKAFAKIAKSAGEKYGSKERGEKVAGAVLAKLRGKGKQEEAVEETTCAGSVAPSVAAPKKASAGGYQFGKGVYESINNQVEKMITEGMSINVNIDTNGQKSINVSATEEDADKLAEILKMAGIGGQVAAQEEPCCETCGSTQCECGIMGESEELANSPDEEYADTDMLTNKLAGGLNKPKTTVAGDGQTTIPVTAVQVKESQEVSKIENSLWNLFKSFKK